MHSVPITTEVVSSRSVQSRCTPVSYNNKTERHDITEILLKVALNTMTLTQYLILHLKIEQTTLYYNTGLVKLMTITLVFAAFPLRTHR